MSAAKQERNLVSFDWAIKKLLRSKANFGILEGFLSELLKDDIRIEAVLSEESDRESMDNKLNRVDLMVKNRAGQRVAVEIQYEREDDYFHRMLFGTAKILSETLRAGAAYGKVVKVISIHIVYFDLGQGQDYVYVGKTHFTGMHKRDQLGLSEYQKNLFQNQSVADIFPDYYILKVNSFNDVAKDGLDEWMYFLKNERIKGEVHAKGLADAKKKLDMMKLSEKESAAYERYQQERHLRASLVEYSVKEAEKRKKQLEEERRQKERERSQKEEALAKLQAAYDRLLASGAAPDEATRILGL